MITRKRKGQRTEIQTWHSSILCLPLNRAKNSSIPRGKERANLGVQGLCGKIRLDSTMSEEEVFSEICSVSQAPMCGDPNFPIQFMQTIGGGSKTLSVPTTASRFTWSGKEIMKMSGQGCIYIQALKELLPPAAENELPVWEAICWFPHYTKYTNKYSLLQIRLVGKPAIDAGGPSCEFFALFHKELAQKLFERCEGHKVFTINIDACRKQHFETIGRIMAMSIVHGGRAPHFFTRSVVYRIHFFWFCQQHAGYRWVSWCWSHWLFETSEKLLCHTTC